MNNELPKIHKKTSFYVCLVLGAFMVMVAISDWLFGSIDLYENAVVYFFWGVVLLLIACLLKKRNDRERVAYDKAVKERRGQILKIKEDLEAQKTEISEVKAKLRAEQAAAKDRQAEWERTHGRIRTKIKGVTFKNEDGSSRQHILKEAMAEECSGSISLELFEENGEEEIAVCYDGDCVGFVPRDRVAEISAVVNKISAGYLIVERFRPEDKDDEDRGIDSYIYRADLDLVYLKDAT